MFNLTRSSEARKKRLLSFIALKANHKKNHKGEIEYPKFLDLRQNVQKIQLKSPLNRNGNENELTFRNGEEHFQNHFGWKILDFSPLDTVYNAKLHGCSPETEPQFANDDIHLNGKTVQSIATRHDLRCNHLSKPEYNEIMPESKFREMILQRTPAVYYVRYITFDYLPPKKGDNSRLDLLLTVAEPILHSFFKEEKIKNDNQIVGNSLKRSIVNQVIPNTVAQYEIGYWLFCLIYGYKDYEIFT